LGSRVTSDRNYGYEIYSSKPDDCIGSGRPYLVDRRNGYISSYSRPLGNIQLIIKSINIWGTVIIILLLGIALYLFRARYRLAYGIFEVIVGVLVAIFVFGPKFDYSNLQIFAFFQILGGLYIMNS
jgi:hypothetical protein